MAASERVKTTSGTGRSSRQWLVIVTAATFGFLLLPATVTSQQVECYYCDTACDLVIPEQIERCAIECGTWYSSVGNGIEVYRGCIEYAPSDAIIYQTCDEDLCNDETPVRCLRCDSIYSNECQEVVCSNEDDQCYLNPADGHRGCTSDPTYETDCLPAAGDGRCSLCTPKNGRSCNENIRCVVCDGSSDEKCLQDPGAVQVCPSSTDQCFRYLDSAQTLHMGCTSSQDFLANCNKPRNCRTCASNECNRDDVFACYSCSDCYSVDKEVLIPIECTIFETNRCYVGYDWQEKVTYRGCASQELLPFDAADLCYETGCNGDDFPVHLQCFQCAGCDQINPADVNYCRSESATGCFMLLSGPDAGSRTLLRGCNTDDAYDECREDQNCVTCSGDGCNGGPKTVPVICTQCSGVDQCEQSGGNTYSCNDLTFYNRCYMYSDAGGTLVKGCLLDLEPDSEVATACYDSDDSRCQYCAGFGCNQQHCVSCDSRIEGLACILGLSSGALRYELCSGGCRVVVDAEGYTMRGCVDPLVDPCEATVECELTLQPGSNGDLFPRERRRCYKCNGDELCKEQQDQTSEQYCPLFYGASDGCYIYKDGSTVVRGCTTDPDARCQTADDPACLVWSDSLSNGAAVPEPISCYQNCPGGDTSELVPSCPPVICSATNNRCFLSVSITGVISRGCTSTIQGCPSDSRDCFVCNEPNCNGVYAVCATCDTEQNADCTVAEEHGDVCEGAAGCFHYVDADREIFGCAERAPTFCTDNADHCQFCQEEPFCNAKAFSFCYSCIDCDEVNGVAVVDTRICPADTCFTGLLGTRIDRGCYSDMPEPIEQYRELQNCAEPFLCNSLARSELTSCYVCADCAQEPNAETSQLCLNPPSNRCYTVLGEDGLVQRGCVGDALPEGCVEELNCIVCNGEDNCNGRVANGVPTPESPGFSCVRCEGENCSDYNQVTVCPNEKGLLFDGCVTYVDGTDVKKGCLSDGELWELCSVEDGLCTFSNVPNGNARTISCFTCSGATRECVQQQAQEAVTAMYEHGGCVVFIQDDGTIVRDNTYEGRSCATNGAQLCTECYTDECNGQLFPSDRLHCYQCRGEYCAQLSTMEGSAIVSQPCLRYGETEGRQCYTRFEGALYAERGCRSDDDVCADPAGPCQLCDDDGCNDGGFSGFQETATCLSCDSNLACDTNPTVQTCSDPSRGCYTFVSGLFVIAKGCVSDVNPSSAWYNDCTPPGGNERCQHCTGDNCNGNRCFVCSSRTSEGCFEPSLGLVDSSACPTEECVAFIDDNGHIVRGCAFDYSEQTASVCSEERETCLQCVGDHCNGGPMPRNRIKCYQCSGSGVDCISPTKDSAKYCPTYEKDGAEGCYTYFADVNTVERGCVAERETDCDGYCQRCSTTECNNQPALMPNTLRCVQCDGVENCGTMTNVPLPCSGELLLGRSDRCYTFFDDGGAVSGRGCLSQLTEQESLWCQDRADTTCKLCSPDGCNSGSVECIVCDSATNPACAGDVLPGGLERRCGTGRCVSLVKEATTWKGCAEDFEEECVSQDEDGARCAIFDGNLSNKGIFPEDRLQCYQCKGDPTTCGLLDARINPEACQWYNPSDECYTYVADSGETIRGCMSDPANSKECTDDPSHCIRCNTAVGCNTAPSMQESLLSCAKCSQAAECTERDRNPVFEGCTGLVLLGRHDSCYTYSFGDETLERGCLSEADPTIRAQCPVEGSTECSVCHCDQCNGPPERCIVCQDAEGCGDVQGAAGRLEDCRTGSCVVFAKQLIDGGDALTIVKGCSEDYEADTCTRGPPDDYQVCQSPGCNDVLFPPTRIRCYQCEGAACSDPSLQPTICEPYVPSKDVCYSFLDRQQKGCVGRLSDEQLVVCLKGDGTECQVCSSEDGCNVEPRVQQCTVCSSQTDPGCADSAWASTTAPIRKPCPTGGCATFIDVNGYTVKDCAVDHQLTDASCAGTPFCFVCTSGDGCNDGLRFPSDRLQCFQCSGVECVDVTLGKPTACQRYDPSDACYTYALGPSSVARGCLSDRPQCVDEACVTCTTPNTGCNTEPALVANEHSCYQCTGGVECAQGQTGSGIACSASLLLGRTDACYTFVDTYTVRRGCLSEEGACDPSNPSCHVCTTGIDCNGNKYEVATHECIQCDESYDGEACRWGYSKTEAIRCPTESLTSNTNGCYSCYGDDAAEPLFRRGCAGDAGQQRCRDDTTLAVCLGTGCNNRNERLQICAKCDDVGCDADNWIVEECRGTVSYLRRGCYILRDTRKRILARGCVADLNESVWQRCLNARDGSCMTCLENQCNRAETLGGRRITGLAAMLTILLVGTFLQP
uniref:DUF753 domain-containing protein n=1 Tax=Anopheles atroparvus TaxID=41427 RepID=A0A182JHF4_ANOAO